MLLIEGLSRCKASILLSEEDVGIVEFEYFLVRKCSEVGLSNQCIH